MEERQLELESKLVVGGREVTPIAWTVRRRRGCGRTLHIVMCREAMGVIVRDGDGVRVLLADGRVLSTDELVDAWPSLADAVAAL